MYLFVFVSQVYNAAMQKSTNTILTVGVLSLSLPLLVAIVGYLNRPKRNISSSIATLTKNYPQVDISLLKAIAALMDSTKGIDKLLRSEIGFDTSVAGSTNASGDDQLKLDISCDECVFANLRKSQVFEIGASEETPSEEEVSERSERTLVKTRILIKNAPRRGS